MIYVKLILTALACIAAVLSIVPTLIAGIGKGIRCESVAEFTEIRKEFRSIWRMK